MEPTPNQAQPATPMVALISQSKLKPGLSRKSRVGSAFLAIGVIGIFWFLQNRREREQRRATQKFFDQTEATAAQMASCPDPCLTIDGKSMGLSS